MKIKKLLSGLLLATLIVMQGTSTIPCYASENDLDERSEQLGPVTSKDVIYQIITDRFFDGEIIDYQADGSINTWTSFHGYHVRNYFATNEHFGDLNQFRELRDALHKNGFSCILSILVGISEIKNR